MAIQQLATGLDGDTVDSLMKLAAVVPIAAIALFVMRQRPRLVLWLWLGTVGLVPNWAGVTFKIYFQPTTVVGIMAIVAFIPVVVRRLGLADWFVVSFFMACLIPEFFGLSSTAAVLIAFTQWAVGFTVGRLISLKISISAIYRVVAVVFTAVAVLAIVEFLFSWNPFPDLFPFHNSLFRSWAPLQSRGGVLRAEGAFGHSIALGACIGLAIPMVIASDFRLRTRVMMVGVMFGAAVVTFSRIGMICSAMSIVLSVLFFKGDLSRRARSAVVAVMVTLAALLIPLVSGVFSDAGTEASGSASYRGLLVSLIPDMSVLGFATTIAHKTTAGLLYFGNFRSIDSALILGGLTYGALPLAIVIALLGGACVLVLSGRATPATIAIVAHIPAVATVALITQYATFLWFVAGLAVCTQVNRAVAGSVDRVPDGLASAGSDDGPERLATREVAGAGGSLVARPHPRGQSSSNGATSRLSPSPRPSVSRGSRKGNAPVIDGNAVCEPSNYGRFTGPSGRESHDPA